MRRKLVKQGGSALTVTLPAEWVKSCGLKPGEEVEIERTGNQLTVRAHSVGKRETISLEIGGLDHALVIDMIISAYKMGYDQIEVISPEPRLPEAKTGKSLEVLEVVQNLVHELVGVEIVEQSENHYIIVDLSAPAGEEFDRIVRRVFLLLLTLSEESLSYAQNPDKAALPQILHRYKMIRKFVTFCIRYLNKYGYSDYRKLSVFTQLLLGLQEIGMVYRYVVQESSKGYVHWTPPTLAVFKGINALLREFYECFYRYAPQKASDIITKRTRIFARINRLSRASSREEVVPLTRLVFILNKIHELQEVALAISYLNPQKP